MHEYLWNNKRFIENFYFFFARFFFQLKRFVFKLYKNIGKLIKIIVVKLKASAINVQKDVYIFSKYFFTAKISMIAKQVFSKFYTLPYTLLFVVVKHAYASSWITMVFTCLIKKSLNKWKELFEIPWNTDLKKLLPCVTKTRIWIYFNFY